MRKQVPLIRLTRVLVVLTLAGGCSDPRFAEQSAVREARIEHHLSTYAAYDAAGPERIEQTVEQQRKLDVQRDEHLKWTCQLAKSMHERDVRRWEEEAPLRRSRIEALLHGHPENIGDTWAKMIY